MNILNLQSFVNSLCADDFLTLINILKSKEESILCSKISNHQIINREHTKGSLKICPLCNSVHIVKNGHTKSGRQKYYCKNCKKSFSDTTNTIAFHSRKPFKYWISVVSDTLNQIPLRKTAALLGISTTTVFSWRHKILSTLSKYKKSTDDKLKSRIETDGFFVSINLKGTKPHNMPRLSKKRTSSAKRGVSNHKVCILTAVDETDRTLIEIAGLGPENKEMLLQFKERFEEESYLITDSKAAFIEFATTQKMKLDQIPSGFNVSNEGNNIATINGIHAQLRTFLRPYRGVSIRHLQGYLDLFRFFKDLRYTTEYPDMNTKTYRYVMPCFMKLLIDDVYKKKIPIDLFKAYGEYKYGIFSNVS